MSTIGDSPVTVTVSDNAAGLSVKLSDRRLVDDEHDVGAGSGAEAAQFAPARCTSRAERRNPEVAGRFSDRDTRQTCVCVAGGDGHARNHAAR